MSQSNECKILWVDDDPGVLATAERLFRYQPWKTVTTSSNQKAKDELQAGDIAVVLADQRMPEETGVQLLEFAEKVSPSTTRILVTGFLEREVIETAVNQSNIYQFLTKPWDDEEIIRIVQEAIRYSKETDQKKKLIREASQQNQQLEELTSDLEKLVEERTLNIERSKNQMERNLAKMRKLVLFIKELSGLRGLDELLILFRREVKKFHQVGLPVLAYETHDERKKILFFNGREVAEMKVNEEWSDGPRIRINSQKDQKYLARQFSRPFAKVIAIPLQRKGWTKSRVPSVLFIENDLPAEKVDYFIEFVSQRIQPLSIAVDRILLEYQAKFVSYQWESTFDGIENPIAIVDREHRLLRSNRTFSRHSSGSNCYRRFSGEENLCMGCPVPQALATGQPSVARVHSKGRIYNVFSYPIKISDEQNLSHVINYYVDMTHSRKLFSQVIQNEKLGEIGLLAGNIAHELNNPLTGIRSLAQVLETELKNKEYDQVYEDVIEIERAAERSQIIIKNLLDFSDPEGSTESDVVDLNEVVSKTLPLLKTTMRNYKNQIHLHEEVGMVRVSMPMLQQVFFNLVTNACQAMEESGEISVATRVEGSLAVLEVTDTGPGIPPAIREHIFEPFFTTKEDGQGTGLGLSLSRSIVERFGGKIDVSSEMGSGATFSVRLPVIEK